MARMRHAMSFARVEKDHHRDELTVESSYRRDMIGYVVVRSPIIVVWASRPLNI